MNEPPARLPAQSLFDDGSREPIDTHDWDDQDLLTKDEARRLQRAADLLREELTAAGPDDAEGLRARLERVNGVLRGLGG